MRILVVEDEPSLRSYLVPLLTREGFTAYAVGTGAEALAEIHERPPDLVLLDVHLPDVSGLEICRRVRERRVYLPVVMLTALDDDAAELRGFAARADDYVSKGVPPEVLVARIRAVLRLRAAAAGGDVVQLGAVTVDLRLRLARRGAVVLSISPRDFDLLAFLVTHPDRVFGRTQLLAEVWGPDFAGDPHNVEVSISRLRQAVEANPNRPVYLHNRRGFGYFLVLDPHASPVFS